MHKNVKVTKNAAAALQCLVNRTSMMYVYRTVYDEKYLSIVQPRLSWRMQVRIFDTPLACHAWSAGCRQLAVCPNSSEIHVYEATPADEPARWERTAVLREHDQVCSATHTMNQTTANV